jgi:RNase P/RNase MRP subunit POP5
VIQEFIRNPKIINNLLYIAFTASARMIQIPKRKTLVYRRRSTISSIVSAISSVSSPKATPKLQNCNELIRYAWILQCSREKNNQVLSSLTRAMEME